MRITIEMSEAESRSTTFNQAAITAGQNVPTSDGGAAPEHLLLALGAQAGPGVPVSYGRAADAGAPPSWLVDVMKRGGERMVSRDRGGPINGG